MKTYKAGAFAKEIGVTKRTLHRWDESGKLKAYRTPSNFRYYTQEQLDEYLGRKPKESAERKTVIYARVSSRGQKDDLENQVEFLRTFANAHGWIVDEIVEDIGSGLNYNRKKWNNLLASIEKGEIARVLVAYKDRFVRFGYEWFETFLANHGCELVSVNNEKLSPEEELVQDLVSIVHVFSCRLYGLRKYKAQIEGDETLCSEGSRPKSTRRGNKPRK